MKAKLEKIVSDTPFVKTYWFSPEKKLRYSPGQFIEVKLPHQHDNRGDARWLTLSSSPTEKLHAFSITHSTKSSSFKRTALELDSGSEFLISDALGDFTLPMDTTIPIVFVAGGIGITPFRSMVKYLYDTKEQRKVSLISVARNDPLIFSEVFSKFSFEHHQHIQTNAKTPDRSKIQKMISKFIDQSVLSDDTFYYIAGPESFVIDIRNNMLTNKINELQLITDSFHGYDTL
jgi:glycine betaine catabolism B